VGKRRLGDVQIVDKMAGAPFPFHQQTDDLDAVLISQGLENM
jgi:hypothetical protein